MHRAHDRPTDRRAGPCRRIGPRYEVFFRPRNPSDSRRLDEPDPENIISNPSEGKIYERVALSHRIGAPWRLCNRLPGKSTPFNAGFPFASFIKDERSCSHIKDESCMHLYAVDVGFT